MDGKIKPIWRPQDDDVQENGIADINSNITSMQYG